MREFIAGMVVATALTFGVGKACEGPPPAPLKYTEFIVDTIRAEPDTVPQFIERIVYVEKEPEFVATQEGGAEERLEDFCKPEIVTQIDTIQGDTVYVAVPTQMAVTAVKTTEPWLWWGNQTVDIFGFDNAGNRKEYMYHSRPGWQFATGSGIFFQEPRFAWAKTAFKIILPFATGYLTHKVIR
jgi:hypothetical protein